MRVRVFKKAQNRVESEDEFDFSQVKLGFWKCEDFASLENFEKCEWVFASLEEKNSLVCFLPPSPEKRVSKLEEMEARIKSLESQNRELQSRNIQLETDNSNLQSKLEEVKSFFSRFISDH